MMIMNSLYCEATPGEDSLPPIFAGK